MPSTRERATAASAAGATVLTGTAGYDETQDATLQAAFNAAVVRGVTLFDTADSYGSFLLAGRSEQLLGRFLRECPVDTSSVVIASKVAAYPWRITRRSVAAAASASAGRLGRPVDLLQVHWSVSNYAPWQERSLWDGVADALLAGDCRAVGLSNFGPQQFARAADYLADRRGVRVASAQAQLSLLSRAPIDTGLVETVRGRGAKFIGYSPLVLGLLAGGPKRDRGKLRNAVFDRVLRGAEPLQQELARVAGERGVSQAQVAQAWALGKADLVLTGVRTVAHAEEAAASAELVLGMDEVERLERAADACPKQMVQNSFQTQ